MCNLLCFVLLRVLHYSIISFDVFQIFIINLYRWN